MKKVIVLLAFLILTIPFTFASPVHAATSADITITATGVLVLPPANFTVTYISDYEIDLSWAKPAGADKTMIRACIGREPEDPTPGSDPSDGMLVYYGTAESTTYFTNLETTSEVLYFKAWSQMADGTWGLVASTGQTEGIGMVLIAFVILALTLTVAGFGLKSGRGILCFAATGAWVLLGVYSYTKSTAEWDIYYALFWLSMGMSLIMPLTAALMRDKKDPVEDPYVGLDDDERAIVQEHETMARDEERLNLLMGKRRPRKSGLSSFSKTGIEKKKGR